MRTNIRYDEISLIATGIGMVDIIEDSDYICGKFLLCKNTFPYYGLQVDYTNIALF
jgi:hypothetical protein